ncbi:MAG: hypothetical protein IPP77_08670 [Bacteroidetes bacterium]|nr:hypothetical protein [Bacteroidota bacterium]
MKKGFVMFLIIQPIVSFATDMNDVDADSDSGTLGLIIVSVFLIAGIVVLALRRKKD